MVAELITCAEKNGQAEETVRRRNKGMNTALHEAARNSHDRVVGLLTRKEPKLAILVNVAGASPLHLATEEGATKRVNSIWRRRRHLLGLERLQWPS